MFLGMLILVGCARNLAGQLVSSNEKVRQAALAKLERSSAPDRREVIPFLSESFESHNANVRRRAAQALERLGADGVPPLVRALQHKTNPRIRAAAAEALGHMGAAAKTALGPLVEAERDADDGVRLWATVSLSKIKAFLSPSEKQLFRLTYGNDKPAPPAAEAPPPFPADDPRTLLWRLRRTNEKQRAEIVAALAAKGSGAVPLLLEAASKDPSESVRDGAAEALRVLAEKGDIR